MPTHLLETPFCGNDREWFLCPHRLCVDYGTHAARKATGRAPWRETISLVCLCTLNPSLNRSWTLCLLRKEPLYPGSPDQNHLNGLWWLHDCGGAPRQTEGWQWVQGSRSPSLSLLFYKWENPKAHGLNEAGFLISWACLANLEQSWPDTRTDDHPFNGLNENVPIQLMI